MTLDETTHKLQSLLRPHFQQGFTAYSSARDEFKGKASIWLDANENSLGSPLDGAGGDWHRYPDPYARKVREALSNWLKVGIDQLFIGHGSDEPIDLLIRLFCQPGQDSILTLDPTYGMYAVSATINNVAVKAVPTEPDFSVDWQKLAAAANDCKLAFLCSPNNPTGQALNPLDIEVFARQFNGLVVVDEAYGDFCPEKSILSLPVLPPNVLVMKTLSKAWGLAALRLGFVIAHPFLVHWLNQIKPPYNLSLPTQQMALQALANTAWLPASQLHIKQQRQHLHNELAKLPLVETVFPSDANFLLVRVRDAAATYNYLAQRGIIVRDRSRNRHCQNCLRITIGTEKENAALVAALQEFQLQG